jgi:hypothetical protein
MTPERVARLVGRWVRFYTRELPAPIAQRRINEIDADVHDHIAHERANGISDGGIALSIVSRMARGLAADLSWRGENAQPTTDQPRSSKEAMNTSNPAYRSIIRVLLVAAVILSLPLLAMQFRVALPDPGSTEATDGVNWTLFDFVFAGVMIVGTGLLLELAARKAPNTAYRAAVTAALAATFFLIWSTGAVGIIGSEDNAANRMYFGVLAIALLGSIVARFRADGMALTMVAAALAQVSVGAIALVGGLGATDPSWPWDVVGATGFFAAPWLGSAWLFRRSALQLAGARA